MFSSSYSLYKLAVADLSPHAGLDLNTRTFVGGFVLFLSLFLKAEIHPHLTKCSCLISCVVFR